MEGEVMWVGYSDRRRYCDGLPSSTSLILLVVVVFVIVPKGGNRRKRIFIFLAVVVVFRWIWLVSKSLRPQVL